MITPHTCRQIGESVSVISARVAAQAEMFACVTDPGRRAVIRERLDACGSVAAVAQACWSWHLSATGFRAAPVIKTGRGLGYATR